jgi:predicted nucleotidyltransferase
VFLAASDQKLLPKKAWITMRLSAAERTGIVQSFEKELRGEVATLFLYGSRTDVTAVGGDIDLLIEVPHPATAARINGRLHYLLSAIKSAIGDQKIDLSVKDSRTLKSSPFWTQALSTAVELGRTCA